MKFKVILMFEALTIIHALTMMSNGIAMAQDNTEIHEERQR